MLPRIGSRTGGELGSGCPMSLHSARLAVNQSDADAGTQVFFIPHRGDGGLFV